MATGKTLILLTHESSLSSHSAALPPLEAEQLY